MTRPRSGFDPRIEEALAPKPAWHALSPQGKEPFPVGWAVSGVGDLDQVDFLMVHGDHVGARHYAMNVQHGIVVEVCKGLFDWPDFDPPHYKVRWEDGKVTGAICGMLRLELSRWRTCSWPKTGEVYYRRTDGMIVAWSRSRGGHRPWNVYWRGFLVRFLDRSGGFRLMSYRSADRAIAAADRICPVAAVAWPGATSGVGKLFGPCCSETAASFKIAIPLSPLAL